MSRSSTDAASPDAKGVDIGGSSGLPMATAVVVVLVLMEAVVVAATRWRCGSGTRGRCCPSVGSSALVVVMAERATLRIFSEAPGNAGRDKKFQGLVNPGLTSGPCWRGQFWPTTYFMRSGLTYRPPLELL
jgi:hypothetical protein